MSDSDLAPVITIQPLPPQQGGRFTITYSGTPGTVLQLDWFPTGTPATVTIPASGSIGLAVPAGATSLTVADPTGGALNQSTGIAP